MSRTTFAHLYVTLVFLLVLIGVSVAFVWNTSNQDALERFKKEAGKYACEDELPLELIEEYYDALGPKIILDAIENKSTFCHTICHNTGFTIYQKEKSLDSALDICGTRCSTGCMHGIIRAMATNIPEFFYVHDVPENDILKDFCDLDSVRRTKILSCVHGVGHVAAMLEEHNISRALARCSEIFEEDKLKVYLCSTGAYMERDGRFGAQDMNVSLHYPCDTQKDHPAGCYLVKMRRFLTQNDKAILKKMTQGGQLNLTPMGDICLNLKEFARTGCFYGLGYSSVEFITRFNSSITKICTQSSQNDRKICIEGLIGNLNRYSKSQSREQCQLMGGQDKQYCQRALLMSPFIEDGRDIEDYYYIASS